jgi:hypothetical protein
LLVAYFQIIPQELAIAMIELLPLAGCFDGKVIVLQSPRRDEILSFNLLMSPIVKKEFVSDML